MRPERFGRSRMACQTGRRCINPHHRRTFNMTGKAGVCLWGASSPDIASKATDKEGGRGGGNSACFGGATLSISGEPWLRTAERLRVGGLRRSRCLEPWRRGQRMFRSKTTIIVGAGASQELGLPVGDGLMDLIKALLRVDDSPPYGFVNEKVEKALALILEGVPGNGWTASQRWRDAARKICDGLDFHQSIDNLLHFFRDDEDVKSLGKLAIAIAISDEERGSYFFREKDGPILDATTPILTDSLRESWYIPVGKKLLAGWDMSNIDNLLDNVTFIVFNYDRCLEQFLSMMIQSTCGVRPHYALSGIIPRTRFIHPYGSLGPLPWQATQGEASRPFGQGDDAAIWDVSRNIKTFTESVESHVAAEIKKAVREATTLLFLGFGYNQQNVDLITPGDGSEVGQVLATAYKKFGHEDQSVQSIIRNIVGQGSPRILTNPGNCRAMFDSFQVTLDSV